MESTRLRAAIAFAEVAHGDQKYGNDPYSIHLQEVVRVLLRFACVDEEMLAAAVLHDTVEDTEATIDQIRLMFGYRVSDLVYRVTNEPGKNRAEKHKKTYIKIKESDDAVQLKLADRIANVERSVKDKAKQLGMYQKEYKGFKKALYTPGLHEEMTGPEDIKLNLMDKFKVFVRIVHEEILPLQVISIWVGLAIATHVVLLNKADWYHNMESLVIPARIAICLLGGVLEGVVIILTLGPLFDKIEKHWSDYEEKYRIEAHKKVEELLLAQKKLDDY